MIVIDGADKAILGVADVWHPGGERVQRVAYCYDRLVKVFMDQGMDWHGAMEWVDVNVVGAYVGPATPIVVRGAMRRSIPSSALRSASG